MSGKTIAFASAVQAGANVPAQDATTDLGERDVVGNKADTEVATGTAASSTLSLMAYLKAMWDLLRINITGIVALAGTALSTAQWTNTRAGYLDNLSAGAVAQAGTALSTAQWSNTRAGYLDNLSVGAVAQAGTALSTTQWSNTRAGYLDNLNGPTTYAWESGQAPILISSGAGANTKGSWVQLAASTAAASLKLIISIAPASGTNSRFAIDIGTGGAGSEVVKIPDLFVQNAQGQSVTVEVPFFNISAGTRVAARCSDNVGSVSVYISVLGI
jgi:hypothetical protein